MELPGPELAKLSLPGLSLRYLISSATLATGTFFGFTTSMFGMSATSVAGAKLVTVS